MKAERPSFILLLVAIWTSAGLASRLIVTKSLTKTMLTTYVYKILFTKNSYL